MGLAELFEFRTIMDSEVEEVKRDIERILEQIKKQCKMLGGKIEVRRESDLYKDLACVFPEPKDITYVKIEEDESGKSSIYIESSEGWHGVKVEAEGYGIIAEVDDMRGNAEFNTATGKLIRGKHVKEYKFIVSKKKRSRSVKRTDRIEYSITPSTIFVRI